MKKRTARTTLSQESQQSCPATSALARQKFNRLEQWLYSEEVSNMGLSGVELGEELRGRELLRLLLQAHIEVQHINQNLQYGTANPVGPA